MLFNLKIGSLNYFFTALMLVACCSCNKLSHKSRIIGGIQSCAKLATTEFVVSKVILARKETKLLFIRTGRAQFAVKTYATIKVGIDLHNLDASDITISDDYVEINLPPVEILGYSYSPSDYEIIEGYAYKSRLTSFSIEEEDELFRKADLEIRELFEHFKSKLIVEENTRGIVSGMLANIGVSNVIIHFEK